MSKKIYYPFLVILVLAFSGFTTQAADKKEHSEINLARWESFCKSNKDKCLHAMAMCEQFETISCDEIQQSFIMNRPIPSLQKNPE